MNNKTKGNNFEKKIAEILTAWAQKSVKNIKFFAGQTFGSGRNKNLPSDIQCNQDFPFVIECKAFDSFNTASKKVLFDLWGQVMNDALNAGKLPLLIVDVKNSITYLIVPDDLGIRSEFWNAGLWGYDLDKVIEEYDFEDFVNVLT